jgi:N-acetylmuramoyl-L-alanine amidase
MRRYVIASALALALAPTASAKDAPGIQASATFGAAPLAVTLTATGPATTYRWELGDGTAAEGAVVTHAYPAGRFTARVTATAPDGEAVAAVQIVSVGVTLRAPRHAVGYGHRLTLAGTVVPTDLGRFAVVRASAGVPAHVKQLRGGAFRTTFRVRAPGAYAVTVAGIPSTPVQVLVKPKLVTRLDGAPAVGQRLAFVSRLVPATSGTLHVRIWKSGALVADTDYAAAARIPLDTARPHSYRIQVSSKPVDGWVAVRRKVDAVVAQPRLAYGSHGPSVRALEQRLWDLRYALLRVDGSYGVDTRDAVVAFQKVAGLPRTGAVDRRVWSALARASVPRARFPSGSHVEVDRTRQVLFEVRDGKVVLAVPVSTGATGNTPLGTWHVYSRVAGWSWVLWFPTYFLRGFAIHGYPDVPTYPASHGCVRVPMWVATRLYSMHPYGYTIRIYV